MADAREALKAFIDSTGNPQSVDGLIRVLNEQGVEAGDLKALLAEMVEAGDLKKVEAGVQWEGGPPTEEYAPADFEG